jgi:hypothetical protein
VSMRAVVLLAIGASFVFTAAPARADCPLTDPACVTETVDPVVEPVVEQVTDVTDPVVETVAGVLENVEDTVGPIVDEGLAPLPGPFVDVTEPSSLPGDGVGPDHRPGPGAPPVGSDNGQTDLGPGSFVERTVPVPALVGGTFVPSLASSLSSDDVRVGPSPPGPSPPIERGGFSVEDVVKGLAFPLALALIVGAFLLAQNRLDRRDPRLALAPVGPDVLNFT